MRSIFLFNAVLCIISLLTVVKVAAIAQKEVEIEDLGDLPHEYKRPLTAMEQHHGSLRRLLSLPIQGMNETCQNSLCEMMESALSCKGIGFGLSKTCATYLLGFLYECPIFPAQDELFNAPYVCLGEWEGLVPPGLVSDLMAGGGASGALNSLADNLYNVHNYLLSNFTENCQRRCLQRYIEQANAFTNGCVDELSTWAIPSNNSNSRYPEVWILEGYQEFRNQVCATDTRGNNCFGKVQKFLPTYYNGSKGVVPQLDPFNHDCNYYDDAGLNQQGMEEICQEFQDFGCCFGNAVAMMAQSQTNQSAIDNHNAIKLFPPCLLRYLKNSCGDANSGNALDPMELCTHGANGNMSVLPGSVTMGKRTALNPTVRGLVNVYDRESLVQFLGVMAYGLLVESLANKLTTTKSLWVEVTDYAYYSSIISDQSDATMLTPTDGAYSVDQSDFANAESLRIDFQIVLEGYTYAEAQTMLDEFVTQYACSGRGLLELLYDDPTCEDVAEAPVFYRAEPFVLPPASAAARAVPVYGAHLSLFAPVLVSAMVFCLF